MRSKTYCFPLLLAAFFVCPGWLNAQEHANISTVPSNLSARQDQTTKIRFLLSAHHQLPDQLSFERVSKNAASILREIVASGPEKRTLDRCLEALSYWPNDSLQALYAKLLRDQTLVKSSQHRLLLLVAKTFPKDAMAAIEPFLEHPDQQLVLTAIHALGSLQTPAAYQRLAKLSEASQDGLIVDAVARASRSIR
jgi:HEAT repeat protein